MAVDPYNLVQAPQAAPPIQTNPTPMELQNAYLYANMLSKNSMQPIGHWTQGVQHMVEALMGGYGRGQADRLGRQPEANYKANATGAFPTPQNMAESSGFNPDSAPSETKTAPRGGALSFSPEGGSDDLLDRAARATAQQESGGNYKEIGPPTKYGRALGKYQIMPENVKNWSKEFLGKEVSPSEFLNSPEIQEAVYRGKMSQYLNKYGVEGAGRAWLGGPGSIDKPERRDTLGTPVGKYGRAFANMVNAGSGGGLGPAPALSMAPEGPVKVADASNGNDAIALALARGAPPTAAPKGFTQTAQVGTQNPPYQIPPSALPGQTTMSKQNIINLMGNPGIDPALKAYFLQQYMSTQVNPATVEVPGGRQIIPVDRTKPQTFIPTLAEDKVQAGDIHATERKVMGPDGKYHIIPEVDDTAPPPARPPVPPVTPPPAPKPQGAIPFAPTAPIAGSQEILPPQFKTAALGNDIPVPSAVPPAPPMGTPPPAPPPAVAPATPPVAAPSPTIQDPRSPLKIPPPNIPGVASPNQVAQLFENNPETAGRIPILSPRMQQSMENYNRQKVMQEQAMESAKVAAKEYGERFGQMTSGALKAQEQIVPHLRQALAMLDNPSFYTGVGAHAVLKVNSAIAGLGELFPGLADRFRGAPNQVFTKGIAGAILDNMRTALGGLGQVRVKEIELLEKAMASTGNSVEANRVLLNMAIRVLERGQGYAEMARDYVSGAAVSNPFSPEHEILLPAAGRRRGNLDENFDKIASYVSDKNKPFSEDEIKRVDAFSKQGKAKELKVNDVEDGYTYIGGDKRDPKSWRKN